MSAAPGQQPDLIATRGFPHPEDPPGNMPADLIAERGYNWWQGEFGQTALRTRPSKIQVDVSMGTTVRTRPQRTKLEVR